MPGGNGKEPCKPQPVPCAPGKIFNACLRCPNSSLLVKPLWSRKKTWTRIFFFPKKEKLGGRGGGEYLPRAGYRRQPGLTALARAPSPIPTAGRDWPGALERASQPRGTGEGGPGINSSPCPLHFIEDALCGAEGVQKVGKQKRKPPKTCLKWLSRSMPGLWGFCF